METDLSASLRTVVEDAAMPVTPGEAATRATRRSERSGRGHPRREVPGTSRYRVASTLAAVMLLVVGLVVALLLSTGPSPVQRTVHPTPRPARWSLTAALSSQDFQLATGNPDAITQIGCSDGPSCFLSTYYGIGGASAVTGSTYVSSDGGHTWVPSALPGGVATTTAVSCPTSTWCAAGGGLLDPNSGDPAAKKEMRDPVLLTTSDGGASWSMHTVPIPPDVQQLPAYGSLPAETTYWPGTVDAVACPSRNVCNIAAHVLDSAKQNGPLLPDELLFLHTSDGGATWTSAVLPETSYEAGFEAMMPGGNPLEMACPTSTECVVMGALGGFVPGVVDAWRTNDSGASWSEVTLPGIQHITPGLSCPSATVCWAGPTTGGPQTALRSTDGGATWDEVAIPQGGWDTISCLSATDCFLGGAGITETLDGGASWAASTVPDGVGAILSMSCRASSGCVAFANPVGASSGGSFVLSSNPDPGEKGT